MVIEEKSNSEMVVGRLDLILTTVYKAQEKVIWTLRKPAHLISHLISTASKKTNTPSSIERWHEN